MTFFVGNAVRNAGGRSPGGDPGHRGGLLARPIGELELATGTSRSAGPPRAASRSPRSPGQGPARSIANTLRRLLRRRRPGVQAEHRARRALRDVRHGHADGGGRGRHVDRGGPGPARGRRPRRGPAGLPGGCRRPDRGRDRDGRRLRPDRGVRPGRDARLQAVPRSRERGTCPRWSRSSSGEPGSPPELQLKGVAECSNMVVAPAIANAIAHATGHRVLQLPARLPRD